MLFRASFLLSSITVLAAAVNLQLAGVRWGDVAWAARTEMRVDVASLKEDVRMAQNEAKSAPSEATMVWAWLRADLKEIRADAAFEAKIVKEQFSRMFEGE